MRYKLLALDLDDTLLNAEAKISPRNREAIRRAVEKNVLVTIATGRMFRSAVRYARELEIALPLIVYHGAMIREAQSGAMLRYCPVPLEPALEILRLTEQEGFHVNLYLDDQIFVQKENEISRYYQTIAPIPMEEVGDLSVFLQHRETEPVKLTLIHREEEKRLDELQRYLEAAYAGCLSVLKSRPYFLEITSWEGTKGRALKHLAELQKIEAEEIIAIGDSYNDLDMLQFAGMGVAMANAPAAVREAANVITKSNLEDGVALFLEEYIL